MIVAHLWLIWKLARWYVDRFIVTDRRIMLVSGIVARRVAMMPMTKLTDMSYHRSTIGVLFGYGTFVLESAGQDQALSRIDYVPRPDELFSEISELLFGRDGERLERPPSPPAPPSPPSPSALDSGPHRSFS